MSEVKLCPVCNGELHEVFYGNDHTTHRCMNCEDKDKKKSEEDK